MTSTDISGGGNMTPTDISGGGNMTPTDISGGGNPQKGIELDFVGWQKNTQKHDMPKSSVPAIQNTSNRP